MRGVPVTAIGPLPPSMPEGSRSVWTTYFAVDDIQASTAAATAGGGSVLLPPGELAPGVQLSIVADPAGAVFGLWQKEKDSPWLREEPGAVDWLELVENGCEASFDFYENVLGVGTSQMAMGDGVYSLFDVGESSASPARSSRPPTSRRTGSSTSTSPTSTLRWCGSTELGRHASSANAARRTVSAAGSLSPTRSAAPSPCWNRSRRRPEPGARPWIPLVNSPGCRLTAADKESPGILPRAPRNEEKGDPIYGT